MLITRNYLNINQKVMIFDGLNHQKGHGIEDTNSNKDTFIM